MKQAKFTSDELQSLASLRFADNTPVIGGVGICSYAGAPLLLTDSAHVDTLCVIGREPCFPSPVHRELLGNLECVAVQAMESRQITHDLAYREAQSRALSEDSPLGVDATDADGACVYTNPKWQAINGLSETQSLGTGWAAAIRPEDKAAVFAQWQTCADSGQTL